jgi:heat shock protein HtpX
MRADVPVPPLVVEPGPEANAWTTRGRIHVTTPLLLLLERSEVEAVLAHELAHLANRDAAVMDVCSAPSRVLLSYAGTLAAGVRLWLRHLFEFPFPGVALWGAILAVVSVPPAFVMGWLSRLSVLGMSRTREFAADAAAAALTGRPSALASALMKLEKESGWLPRDDLRAVEARAVLSILGSDSSRLGSWFSTHPPTAARVKRLEAIEGRLQAGGQSVPHGLSITKRQVPSA